MLEVWGSLATLSNVLSLFGILATAGIISNYNSKRFSFYFDYLKDGLEEESVRWLERDRFPIASQSGGTFGSVGKLYEMTKDVLYRRKDGSVFSIILKYTLACCVISALIVARQTEPMHYPFQGFFPDGAVSVPVILTTFVAALFLYLLPFPGAHGVYLRNSVTIALPILISWWSGSWLPVVIGFVNAFCILFIFYGRSIFRVLFAACALFCLFELWFEISGNRDNAIALLALAFPIYLGGEIVLFSKSKSPNQFIFALICIMIFISIIVSLSFFRDIFANPLISLLAVMLLVVPPLSALVSTVSFYFIRRLLPDADRLDGRHVIALSVFGLLCAWIFTQASGLFLRFMAKLGAAFDLEVGLGATYVLSSVEVRFLYCLFVISLLPVFVAVVLAFYQAMSINLRWKVTLQSQPGKKPDLNALSHDCRLLALTDTVGLILILGLSIMAVAALHGLVTETGFELFHAWLGA